MGIIKKIFGGIFSFLGGILKIFGIGKSDYYMEADNMAPSAPAAPPAPKPEPTPAKADPPAKAEASAPKPAPAPQPAASVPQPASTPAPAPALMETFAPKFLTPTSNGKRRRPGPSLGSFMDMARQVKTPT
jgi:hypothetical protein